MYVTKKHIKHCNICDKVESPMVPDPDFEPADGDSEATPDMVSDPKWLGVAGYRFGDDVRSWRNTECCYSCMAKLVKGVGLIGKENLTMVEFQ